MNKILLVLFILLVYAGDLYSQENPYLKDFKIAAQGNELLITWTTRSGFTCSDLEVEYGIDSNNFRTVHRYPGICGSSTTDEDYFFLFEEAAVNRNIYFRINLGVFGNSEILSTIVRDYNSLSGIIVIPHPAKSDAKFFFFNPQKEMVICSLYSLQGSLIASWDVYGDNHTSLQGHAPSVSGMYLLKVDINGMETRKMFFFEN